MQSVLVEPLHRGMVVELGLSGFDFAREAIHVEVESLVLISHVLEKFNGADAQL